MRPLFCSITAWMLLTSVEAATPLLLSKADTTAAVSITAAGPSQQPLISGNGQVIAFNSSAPDLIQPSLNVGFVDIFARDMGAGGLVRITTRLDGKAGGDGNSSVVQLSRTGRFILFVSEASNLVANDTNGVPDIFLHDLQTHTTQLISVAPDGATPGNAISANPSMSSDGMTIVFDSTASNLVAADQNSNRDVFVRDVASGITTRLSADPAGGDSLGGWSDAGVISPDGQRVSYLTLTTNIVATGATRGPYLLVHDLASHATFLIQSSGASLNQDFSMPFTTWSGDGSRMMFAHRSARRLFSVQFGGQPNPADTLQEAMDGTPGLGAWSISGDGSLGAHSLSNHIYLWNFKGPSQPWTLQSSQPLRGWDPHWNVTASQLFFVSDSNELDPQSTDSRERLYALDLATKQFRPVAPLANQGHSAPPRAFDLSDDGSRIVFESAANDVVPGDRNGFSDIFLADSQTGTITLLSQRHEASPNATALGLSRIEPRGLSDDGRLVLFSSTATDLAPGDGNEAQDLFAMNLESQTIQGISQAFDGKSMGSHPSYSGTLSGNGRFAAFISSSTNLVSDDTNGVTPKLFVRDLQARTTRLISTNAARLPVPTFSSDGSTLVFLSTDSDPVVQLHDTASYTTVPLGIARSRNGDELIQVSKDGSDIAIFATVSGGNGVQLIHRKSGTKNSILLGSVAFGAAFQLSPDGQSLVYAGRTNTSPAIQILKLTPGSPPKILSLAPDGISPARGACSEPALDETGRYVAFTSVATNLAPATVPFISQVYIRDLEAGVTRLVSISTDGLTPGNKSSRSPSLSANGRYILFWSAANNLVADDINASGDYFVRDLQTGTTQIIGRRPSDLTADAKPSAAFLSRDGTRVVFNTFETYFGTLDLNRSSDVFASRLEPDLDADGIDDTWEAQFAAGTGLNPNDDSDLDGVSNHDEFIAGTRPNDPTSFTRMQAQILSDGSVQLRWSGEATRAYRIQSSESVTSPAWELESFAAVGTGAPLQWSPSIEGTQTRFYRLLVLR